VDLIVITTCESHEEDKNLKFSLEFTRGITSQEREVDDDRVQVEIKYDSEYWSSVLQAEMQRGAVVVAASEDDYGTSEGVPL